MQGEVYHHIHRHIETYLQYIARTHQPQLREFESTGSINLLRAIDTLLKII